jgi:hypothetical protein
MSDLAGGLAGHCESTIQGGLHRPRPRQIRTLGDQPVLHRGITMQEDPFFGGDTQLLRSRHRSEDQRRSLVHGILRDVPFKIGIGDAVVVVARGLQKVPRTERLKLRIGIVGGDGRKALPKLCHQLCIVIGPKSKAHPQCLLEDRVCLGRSAKAVGQFIRREKRRPQPAVLPWAIGTVRPVQRRPRLQRLLHGRCRF